MVALFKPSTVTNIAKTNTYAYDSCLDYIPTRLHRKSSMTHWSAVKRILCYLNGTKNYGITYKYDPSDENSIHAYVTNPETNEVLHGYPDASYANTDDYKSTSGYLFMASGRAIT
jgi:hypothetical protein